MKFFSFSRERIPLLITLAIVISLAGGYYFEYVPENESDIKQWKFRSLENIGRNIQSKIQLGHKQLTTYLHSDKLFKSQEVLSDSVNKYLHSLHTENFPISNVETLKKGPMVHDTLIVNTIPKKLTIADTIIRGNKSFGLSLTYDFDKFVRPLLIDQVFDEYLILGNNVVLYETFNSGQYPCKDTLFSPCEKLISSMIADREYAGTKYKLFILPLDLNADTRIIVVGLLTADHYSQAKTRLPPRLVLFLITLFTCILVTFPIVKLYNLDEEDRLTLKDVLSVTIVSMLLMSLIFLCFVKYSSVFSEDKQSVKLNLANSISTAFVQEIRENYLKLDVLDECIEGDKRFKKNFYELGKPILAGSKDSVQLSYIDSIVHGLELDRLFWMGKNGVEFRTWTSGSKGFFPGRFDQRAYFKNTVNGRNYSIEGLPNSKLYVDQVVSWISGEFLTVIAKPTHYDTAQVVTISFRPQSLKSAKIPPGYAFAMIDYDGRVLYHSDTTKNLNENLFDEFLDEKNLQSSIKAGASRAFKTQYFGKEYHVQMKPVDGGLPYYLVILESLMFEEYRDINVYSFTLSMQLVLFVLIIIQALAIFYASAKRSIYETRTFETSWLGPKSTSRKQYIFAGTFNLIQLAILCFLFKDETVLTRLFMLLASIFFMPLFLNILFYDTYKKAKASLAKIKLRAVYVGMCFILFLNFIAYVLLAQSIFTLLMFQGLVALIGGALRFFHANVSEIYRVKTIFCYKRAYTCMLVSWMLVAMGFSVILFFRAAYNYDQRLIARYTQLEFAEANASETVRKISKEGISFLTDNQKALIGNKFYKDKYWVDSVNFASRKQTGVHDDDDVAINLLKSFHLYSSENIPDRIHLNNPSAFDFSFYFNNLIRQDPDEGGSSLTYFRLLKNDHLKDSYLVIKSAALDFHLPPWTKFSGFLPWFVFVVSLIAFGFIASGLIRKIFSLNMAEISSPEPFDFRNWQSGKDAAQIFLIDFNDKLPISGKSETTEEAEIIPLDLAKISLEKKKDLIIEWNTNVATALNDTSKPVLLEHFEHSFKDVATSNCKMLLLEKLVRSHPERKILIRSSIHPSALLTAIGSLTKEEGNGQNVERWHALLRNFKIIINPLPINFIQESAGSINRKALESKIFDSYTENYHQYFSIWQSLSEEEKFLLYDLSEDGLVNAYDKNTFRLLIKKGLVKPVDGRLKIFTKGFRIFILSGLSQNELSGIMAKINNNANWNKIRMPLVLVSVAILIFIFSSQREASTKLLTTLGALATAIPALINLLSAVPGNGNKKAAS